MNAIALPKVSFTTSIPETARGRSKGGGENIFQKLMLDMPAPSEIKTGKGKDAKTEMQYAHFFVPAEVPDTITDPAEREKAAKDGTTKLTNRFTSISRRIRKANSATHDFTFRKARDPEVADGTGTWGLIVYRIQPGTDKGGPPKTGQAAGQAAA